MVFLLFGVVLFGLRLPSSVKQVKAEAVPIETAQVNQEEIQAELDFSEIDVVNILEKQIVEYQSMMEQGNKEQLQMLICKTQEIIKEYEQAKDKDSGISPYGFGDGGIGDTAVPLTIAGFSAAQCKLSAELLTVSYNNANIFISEGKYVPVYGGRVVSAPETIGIANGSQVKGSGTYNYSLENTVNQNDLALAIHGFDYNKLTADSTTVTITDIYDFAFMYIENPIVTIGNDIFWALQEIGAIQEFPVEITIDVSKALDLEVHEKINKSGVQGDNDFWRISVTNNTGVSQVVEYNQKMCFQDDASEWTNLKDCETKIIPANGSITVQISTNGTAGYITTCYCDNNRRIITYAHSLTKSGGINVATNQKVV